VVTWRGLYYASLLKYPQNEGDHPQALQRSMHHTILSVFVLQILDNDDGSTFVERLGGSGHSIVHIFHDSV
jgi:hypothetical protein